MQKLLPGVVIAVALYFVVKYPAESADWVATALDWLSNAFNGILDFFKQLVQ